MLRIFIDICVVVVFSFNIYFKVSNLVILLYVLAQWFRSLPVDPVGGSVLPLRLLERGWT